MQITDQQIVDWLMTNVAYLEVKGAAKMKVGGWWPVSAGDYSAHDPADVGLDLCEWIERQIKLERWE